VTLVVGAGLKPALFRQYGSSDIVGIIGPARRIIADICPNAILGSFISMTCSQWPHHISILLNIERGRV
jgi:hypothetical protein